jgi:hypothetical protein
MKGLKFVFPIMGVFLVIYIASVVMNGVKMNGIVAQLNDLYDEDFTIVSSSMGNVFFDEDFEVAARSNKTERVYEFTYNEGTITGDYLLENKLLEIAEQIKQISPDNSIVLTNTGDKVIATEEDLILDSLQITIVVKQETINKEELVKKIREAYSSELVNVFIYEGVKDQVEKVSNELVKYYPQSKITGELLANYKFKETIYVY